MLKKRKRVKLIGGMNQRFKLSRFTGIVKVIWENESSLILRTEKSAIRISTPKFVLPPSDLFISQSIVNAIYTGDLLVSRRERTSLGIRVNLWHIQKKFERQYKEDLQKGKEEFLKFVVKNDLDDYRSIPSHLKAKIICNQPITDFDDTI